MAARSNIAFKIATRPLQAAVRSARPSDYWQPVLHRPPTTYRSATIHALQAERRRIVPKARPNNRPKRRQSPLY